MFIEYSPAVGDSS